MKRYLAIGLLFVAAASTAIECGPSVRVELLDQLRVSIKEADERLSQHTKVLVEEQDRLLSVARPGNDFLGFDKLNIELGYLNQAQTSLERLDALLSASWLLAIIRDGMLDVRDKVIVSGYLSIQLSSARQRALTQSKSINSTLTKISRPGVAIDVGKSRDAIDVVLKTLAICTPPPLAVSK